MGLFSNLFKETPPPPKPVSRIEQLKEIGIDFFCWDHTNSEEMEISIDDELQGFTRKTYKVITNEYFSTAIFSDRKDGTHNLFLSKGNATERHFKDTVDKFNGILGQDWLFRKEFSTPDLYAIRGEMNEDMKIVYANGQLRRWKDDISRHFITIFCFDHDEDSSKNLCLSINPF